MRRGSWEGEVADWLVRRDERPEADAAAVRWPELHGLRGHDAAHPAHQHQCGVSLARIRQDRARPLFVPDQPRHLAEYHAILRVEPHEVGIGERPRSAGVELT